MPPHFSSSHPSFPEQCWERARLPFPRLSVPLSSTRNTHQPSPLPANIDDLPSSFPSPVESRSHPHHQRALHLVAAAHGCPTARDERRKRNLSLLDTLDDEVLEALAGELKEIGREAAGRTGGRSERREHLEGVEGVRPGESVAGLARQRTGEGRRRASFPAFSPTQPATSQHAHRPRHLHVHYNSQSSAAARPSSPSSPSPLPKPLHRARTPPPPYALEDPLPRSISHHLARAATTAAAGSESERFRRRTDFRPEHSSPLALRGPVREDEGVGDH